MSQTAGAAPAETPRTSTNAIDTLVAQIPDDSLRRLLSREIELLRGSRRFGLVFDRHLPESVRLYRHPIRVGAKVALRDESQPDAAWRVTGFADGRDGVALLEDGSAVPVEDLVVVREFGEPVYPGLRSIERHELGGEDGAWHTVINGENHHVLRLLRQTHREAVDLIYIDPPYNTGGKTSWLYNDRFVDSRDRARSSKWLSFMERRLVLARDLLKPSGAIMISIGDDEQHRLRMLMDQIYGPENCVAVITVEMSTTSGPKTVNAQQGTIVKNSEFVLIYRKSAAFDAVQHTPLLDGVEGYDGHYSVWLNDDGTLSSLAEAMAADEAVLADIQRYGLASRSGGFSLARIDKLLAVSDAATRFVSANLTRIARVDRAPVTAEGQSCESGRWIRFEADHRSYLLTATSSGGVQSLMPLSLNYRVSDDYKPRFGRTVIRGDLWRGFHQDMGNVAKEGGLAFENGKKPIRLISQLIRWANNAPDAVILDFFGGSGSTTHAVMAMNAADGGRRRSLLVTNNEVGLDAAKKLRRDGHHPGDPAWEAAGVFEAVTRPRLSTVVTGGRPDGSPYPDAVAANVEFFELAYVDPGRVRRGREFEALAPLLWLRAGGTGVRIAEEPDEGWALTDSYGILFGIDALRPFAEAVTEAALSGRGPRVAFVVTDSEAEFHYVGEHLPAGLDIVQLYQEYLTACRRDAQAGGAV